MPNLAQKLCHDIVEPVIKRSSTNAGRVKSTNRLSNTSSSIKQNNKPTKFVHIDRKTSSKNKTLHTDGMTIIKSKTSILKSLAEAAVNTLVTGPLRCDNNCVTVVRKRDHYSSCKCGNKRSNAKCSAKSIQTLKDISRMDKACIHCIQTATCGTQLLDKNSMLGNQTISRSSRTQNLPGNTRIEPSSDRCLKLQRDTYIHHYDNINRQSPSLRFVTAKRWALSNYPTRGPDF